MSEQVWVRARVDKELKQEVTEIYESMGLDLQTVIRMFLVKSKMDREIPFEMTLPKEMVTRSEALDALEDMFEQEKTFPKCHWMRSTRKSRRHEHRGSRDNAEDDIFESYAYDKYIFAELSTLILNSQSDKSRQFEI